MKGSGPHRRRLATLLAAVLLMGSGSALADGFDRTYAAYDALLKRFVSDDARVDYLALKADRKALDQFLDNAAKVSQEGFDSWPQPEQLAFLINLYNAATLQLIIDHYPVKSIKDIGGLLKGPWDQPVVRLFGRTITLNNLEHDILRKRYGEPRIHLALVCAAKGCPPLRREAYMGQRLDPQLDDQARRYLSSPAGLRIDRKGRTVFFSSIFKWYGEDFVAKYTPPSGFSGLDATERAVAGFCSAYLDAPGRAFLSAGNYRVRYLDYDWSLNGR